MGAESLRVLIASALVLIPCFWHRQIQATDLGSHVYNAWLAQLIQRGAARGLHIVPQNSNVLFDILLSFFFGLFGPNAAEHIAVSLAVLVFFWGGFALCSAAARQPAWTVTPLLAMVSYGFMFNMGFFNLYLSVGLSLFALAIIWRGRRWDLLALAPLGMLIWMAHLMGTAGLVVLGGFLLAARWLSHRWQLAATAFAITAYFLVRAYVLHHYYILPRDTSPYWMLGADYLVIYGSNYIWISLALLVVAGATLALHLYRERFRNLSRVLVWVNLYVILAVAELFAPGGIVHPKLLLMGYVPDRLSLYTVIALCAVLASLRPSRSHAAALGVIALAFFALLYRDTARVQQIEDKVEAAVSHLPAGRRVVSTFFIPPESRIHNQHLVDRACVGYCFSYGNYEPSSQQFRIKADPGNPIVTASQYHVRQMQQGIYVVQPEDLPLVEVYACGSEICLHDLKAGEYNGYVAYLEIAPAAYRHKPPPAR